VNAVRLAWAGFAIIFVGFLVAALGTFQTQGGSSSAGGFILIGPIPIIFGSGGQGSGTIVTIAIVLSAVMIAMYLVSFLLFWRGGRRQEEVDPRPQE
jgi:uncharacterized membrane protein